MVGKYRSRPLTHADHSDLAAAQHPNGELRNFAPQRECGEKPGAAGTQDEDVLDHGAGTIHIVTAVRQRNFAKCPRYSMSAASGSIIGRSTLTHQVLAWLSKDALDQFAVNIREAVAAALEFVGQPFVIDAE